MYRSYDEDVCLSKEISGQLGDKAHPALKDLIGAQIVDVGMHPGVQEGGLTIDFLVSGKTTVQRVIFGYTELGEWIEWAGKVKDKLVQPVVVNVDTSSAVSLYNDVEELLFALRCFIIQTEGVLEVNVSDAPELRQIGFQIGQYVLRIGLTDFIKTNEKLKEDEVGFIPNDTEGRDTWAKSLLLEYQEKWGEEDKQRFLDLMRRKKGED